MQKSKFEIVVACDLARGIGLDNKLPWQLPTDMKYFRDLTKGDGAKQNNIVIMGRNTWDSIPAKRRPLPGRLNIVLSSQLSSADFDSDTKTVAGMDVSAFQICSSLESALEIAGGYFATRGEGRCFVIGGAKVYRQALDHESCDRLYLTQINSEFDCDVFFPEYQEKFSLLSETEVHEENGVSFSFKTFEKVAHQ